MRQITTHQVNECNEAITIAAVDGPGSGGANHEYMITLQRKTGPQVHGVIFQNGPIAEVGTNGLTHEALLAIVKDRLEAFQAGPFACSHNRDALAAIDTALECLKERTRERLARNVEGTHKV